MTNKDHQVKQWCNIHLILYFKGKQGSILKTYLIDAFKTGSREEEVPLALYGRGRTTFLF